jgi:signal transduction histidine kinase
MMTDGAQGDYHHHMFGATTASRRFHVSRLFLIKPTPLDLALVLAGLLVQIGGTAAADAHHSASRSLDLWGVIVLAVGPLALLFRRQLPRLVLAIAFVSTLGYWVSGYSKGPIFFALIVAYVHAAIGKHRVFAWGTIAAGYVTFLWFGWLIGANPAPSLGQIGGLTAWLLVLATTVEFARSRRERRAEAARTRAEETRRRASEERLLIARELHDVLAHNISLINVQAGVGLHLMDEHPEQSRIALTAIKQASKEALGELRSVLDVLRRGENEAPRMPTTGLERLDDLVSRASVAGLDVRVERLGESRPLPPGVNFAAYRIAQEALTNVVRHAGATIAVVTVEQTERDLIVQIDDNGRNPPPSRSPAASDGSGIRGMRERANALGGTLVAQARAGGGFRVRAWFPIEEQA